VDGFGALQGHAKLSAEYSLQRLELKPDPRLQSTWIHVVEPISFHEGPIPAALLPDQLRDRSNNVQALFVYRYLPPFGTIQVAYQRGTAAFGQRSTQGNTLFLRPRRFSEI